MSKNNYIVSLLIVIVLSVLIIFTQSYEDKERKIRRFEFYKKIKEVSNYTVTVGSDPINGLYCKANDMIDAGTKVLKIPYQLSLCPYFIYPFKFEIVNFLDAVPGLNQTIGREQKFSVYVLVYRLLYELYGPKDFINNYIQENNIEAYMNLPPDGNKEIEDSFPNVMLGGSTLDLDHYEVLKQLGYPTERGQELEMVFKYVLSKVMLHPHMEAMFAWISNFDRFKHAYGIVMSRGMTLRLNEYYTLVELKKNQPKYSEHDLKNLEINKRFGVNVGCPCIVTYIDLCNHYQPKSRDLRDKRPIILDTSPGHFINATPRDYDIDEEISFTYSNEPSDIIMFLHYGFVLRNNKFNTVKIKVEDENTLNLQQFNICRELKCVESTIRDPQRIPKLRQIPIRLNDLNKQIINYGRVKFLKPDADSKKVLKLITQNKAISYNNELSAFLFYYKSIKKEYLNNKEQLSKSIRYSQKYRNKRDALEKVWKDNDSQRKQWRSYKHFDIIYTMDLNYKGIIANHTKGVLNKMIKIVNDDVSRIKNKMLASFKS